MMIIPKKISLPLTILVLTSCGRSEPQDVAESLNENESLIVLIDSIDNNLKKDTSTSKQHAEFHPLYIGERTDTVFINYNPGDIDNVTSDRERFRPPDSPDLKISLDTTKLIASVQHYVDWTRADSIGELNPFFYSLQYQSYPVIIENTSNDTLEIGYGEYIPLIIEAQDESGKWKPIQRHFIYGCGTGMLYYFLPPDQILITSCKLFEGEFKTKMRLAYGWENTIYSNEFVGYINLGQFDY